MPTITPVAIGNPNGGPLRQVNPEVDETADHALFPATLLAELDITPLETNIFTRIDDSQEEYATGVIRASINGKERQCPVVFGTGDVCLLGYTTLSVFNLEYDETSRELIPAQNLYLGRVTADGKRHGESPAKIKPTVVAPLSNHRIMLIYSDGAAGEVDLSDLAGQGPYTKWDEPGCFETVHISENGTIVWQGEIELCPDELYAKLTPMAHPETKPICLK